MQNWNVKFGQVVKSDLHSDLLMYFQDAVYEHKLCLLQLM